jgi:hypothetical protein
MAMATFPFNLDFRHEKYTQYEYSVFEIVMDNFNTVTDNCKIEKDNFSIVTDNFRIATDIFLR